ncbi:pilus assembly protein PilV [Paucibacter sp. APW11]|uniref:Pilus assembly protein PilV n=1 Tax=Roseateles aquae TaxID=3077235 RepID=A0ABU3PHW6_9BURK|nr:pilus assembly protein PilV [Paucibacter sp. APW11]MDT9002138.1 pilus assembly protein PilV [Paucibacter sp. APW11]
MKQLPIVSRRSRKSQQGIALLEALVGILIFAFGVLGLVGLQASMTRAQSSAKVRADAANLASELVGIMWSDAAANLASYGGNACASYARCKDWQDKVVRELPGGSSRVTIVDATTGEVAIHIGWSVPNEGAHQYDTSAWVQP